MPFKSVEARRDYQRRRHETIKSDPERWADYRIARAAYRKRYQAERPEIHRAGNQRHSHRRREQLAAIKMAAGCVDCGYSASPDALQFDHVDPATKAFTISVARTASTERMTAELAKCVVRCANCHAIRSARQQRELRGRA